jgi:hypothetical protein
MKILTFEAVDPRVPCPYAKGEFPATPRGVFTSGGSALAGYLAGTSLRVEALDHPGRPSGLTDFFPWANRRIVSASMRSIFESVAARVEYFPVAVMNRGRIFEDEYFLANPLVSIRGIDLTASQVELDEVGVALSVEKLVLDEKRFDHVPLALLFETAQIIVDEKLANSVEKSTCVGYRLIEPSEVRI